MTVRDLFEVRAILEILVKYGLKPAFADAVEDPGRLFGSSVSDDLLREVNQISAVLYGNDVTITKNVSLAKSSVEIETFTDGKIGK